MRFDFCGNVDCPEWVLAEIALLNRMSAVKLKVILGQMIKKICGSEFNQEKLQKLCRDSKMDPEETKCVLAILEFVI